MAKYYMDCTNEDCGWLGVVDWDKTTKCPECGFDIEPSNEGPPSDNQPVENDAQRPRVSP